MKKTILFTFIVLSMLLAACSAGTKTSTVVSTVLPPTLASAPATEPPTVVPTEVIPTVVPTTEVLLASETPSGFPADLAAQLDTYLQSQVYTDGGDPTLAVPGLVLLVDTPQGRYLNAAGVANLDDGTPMKVSGILEIGSNTKSMTVVLLMQLVEQGLISLDDPLSKYLPEQAAMLPNGDQITIRQMAQHTAGLWDYADEIMADGITDPAKLVQGYTPEELVQYAAEKGTPYFTPGEVGKWHYSNTGYILLGMIIEKISGEKLVDLMKARIFDPLSLKSAVLLNDVPQKGQITTSGSWFQEDGTVVDTTNWNGSQGWSAGSVVMTAEDLATYAKALSAGELFQNPDTLNEMLTFDQAAVFNVGGAYGLGLLDFEGDGSVWGHAGQTLGFQSLWFTDPKNGTVVVGLTNSASYKAFNLLNVLNIVEGKGAQPLSSLTLLPVGQYLGTTWSWEQLITPAEATKIDETAGLNILLNKDGSVVVNSADCGQVNGTYTSTGMGNISFDIDDSPLTCAADSQAEQLVKYLNEATSWSFNNGSLLIELTADAGTLVFKFTPPQ